MKPTNITNTDLCRSLRLAKSGVHDLQNTTMCCHNCFSCMVCAFYHSFPSTYPPLAHMRSSVSTNSNQMFNMLERVTIWDNIQIGQSGDFPCRCHFLSPGDFSATACSERLFRRKPTHAGSRAVSVFRPGRPYRLTPLAAIGFVGVWMTPGILSSHLGGVVNATMGRRLRVSRRR